MIWLALAFSFIAVLFIAPRFTLAVVAVCAAGSGYFVLKERNERQKSREEREAVWVTPIYDRAKCTDLEYPISVAIWNQSERTVNQTEFHLRGYREGYSNPIYETTFPKYSTDRIIDPGQVWTSCWRVPKKASDVSERDAAIHSPPNLTWRAEAAWPTFAEE